MSLVSAAGLSWDGTDLGDETHGLRVVSRREFYMPKPRVFYEDLAGVDGGVLFTSTKGPFVLSYECIIVGHSPTERDTFMTNVIAALSSHTEGEKTLIRGWDSAFSYSAALNSGLDSLVALTGHEFTLKFLVPNPVKVGV